MSTESQYYQYNPEKKNIFVEIHQGRVNIVGAFILSIFMLFASHASAIVEVFLRSKFGERYITLAQSIGLSIFLLFAYEWIDDYADLSGRLFYYAFVLVYLGFSIRHRLEIRKYGTAYDFKRFSLSDGELASFWSSVIGKKIAGIKVKTYHVHVFLEPAMPFFAGVFFLIFPFSRAVGVVLTFCGFIYSIRNFVKAQMGRNWVLDTIDKQLSNEMSYDIFMERKPKKDTKGVYLPVDLPDDENTRKSLYNMVKQSTNASDSWVSDFLEDENEKTGD